MVAQPVLSLRAFFIFFFFFSYAYSSIIIRVFLYFLLILFQNLFVKKFFASRFSNKDSWKIIEDKYLRRYLRKNLCIYWYMKKKKFESQIYMI